MGNFYPVEDSSFYLIGGVEFVSWEIKVSAADAWEEVGTGGTGTDTLDAKYDDSITGFLFGVGMDFPMGEGNTALYGSATYSLATYDDMIDEVNVEWNAGGLSLEGGVKVYFPSE